MKINSKLMKMNLHQLEEICNKMKCNHGTKSKMIQNLLKPIRLNYKFDLSDWEPEIDTTPNSFKVEIKETNQKDGPHNIMHNRRWKDKPIFISLFKRPGPKNIEISLDGYSLYGINKFRDNKCISKMRNKYLDKTSKLFKKDRNFRIDFLNKYGNLVCSINAVDQKTYTNLMLKISSLHDYLEYDDQCFSYSYKMESKSFSKFKKGYIDNLKKDEKYLQNILKNKEKNLKKVKSEKKSKWFVDKANKEIEILQTKIMEIKNQIENITDDEIREMYTKHLKILMEKEKKGQQKMLKKIEKKKKKDMAYSEDLKKTRAERKVDRDFNRQLKQAYRHYQRVKIPTHLQEKLKKMSGNRGFIYKSIHYYGHLPDKKYESVILTERKPDGTFLTHEYTDTEYILHSKAKNGKQKIVSRKKLKVPVPERKKKKKYYKKKKYSKKK